MSSVPTSRNSSGSMPAAGSSVYRPKISGAARTATSGDRGEHDERDGDDDVRRLVVVALEERREQRHEGRREDAADQQLVDDVRRLVADRVGVGQRGLADHVAEDDDAQQAR